MRKLHLIMPMGGGGTRFGNKGFRLPKPLIMLQGKPFFYWAVESVRRFVDVADITFVVLREHIDEFHIHRRILDFYPEANIQVIPHVLNGAVLTCLEGVKAITDDAPLLFNDCDHAFVSSRFNDYANAGQAQGVDGALLTFISDSPNFSYVRFDEAGQVCGTIEKQVVSNEAICGAYFFRNKETFLQATETYLHKCAYSEFFVSGVFNEMAAKGQRITTFPVDTHISFGTPAEYDLAENDPRLTQLLL